jgi:aminoglycoside phosphotransferase (APT) family kinase protein
MALEVDLDQLAARLAPVALTDLRPLTGGASSLTYRGTRTSDREPFVVKMAPPGVPPVLNRDVLRQARLLRALHGSAVPVPRVLWEDIGDPPDVPPLFVMSYVEGASLEPLFDRDGEDPEPVVAERMRNAARTMAALHALDPIALGLTDEPEGDLSEEIERWCRSLGTVDPELAPGWQDVAATLHAHEPPARRAAVVHGDFRLGNLLASGAAITAVVDWEIWSIADPRLDVGWFLVNADPDTYGRATRYAGALPPPDELAELYADALGETPADLAWFRALALFKSTATWSLIVKHNRRRTTPDPELEALAPVLPRLLARATALAGG